VADQHEPATAVVVREIAAPGGPHVDVGALDHRAGDAAAEQARQRDLTVDGREHAAVARVVAGLVERDREQLGVDRPVGRRRRLVADRGIDVEAVDPAPPRPPRALGADPLGRGREARRVEPRLAGLRASPGLHSQTVFASATAGTAARHASARAAGAGARSDRMGAR